MLWETKYITRSHRGVYTAACAIKQRNDNKAQVAHCLPYDLHILTLSSYYARITCPAAKISAVFVH